MSERPIDRLARLTVREARLRELGRELELVPARRGEADVYFHAASRVRETRLRIAAECGLI